MFKDLAKNESVISVDVGNTENIQKNKLGAKSLNKLNDYLGST